MTIEYVNPYSGNSGDDFLVGHRAGWDFCESVHAGAKPEPAAHVLEPEKFSAQYRNGFSIGSGEYDEALVAAAGPVSGHEIEERSVVYLRLSDDGTRWEIDSPTDDGWPLEGYDDGALNETCECGDPDGECQRALDWANHLPKPTAPELMQMLANYLGYTIISPAVTPTRKVFP